MASNRRAFRAYALAAGVAVASITALAAARAGGVPTIGAVLLFCGLIVFSSNNEVEFAEGSVVNADFMVLLAAVVAFHHDAPILGPAAVGLARACDLVALRRHTWSAMTLNAASGVLGVVAASEFLLLFPREISFRPLPMLLAAVPTSAVCVFVLWLVLAPAFMLRGQALGNVISTFAPRAIESLPFSVLGFFLGGLYLGIGAAAVLMLVVPILIAREVFASYIRVKESHEETVYMLIRALERKDHYTAGHAERVATYARYVGEELNFMPARLDRLRFAALMHDIGKLVVPNHILNKPGRLTPEEFNRVRIHEKVGVQMLSHIDFLRPIAPNTHGDAMHFDPDNMDHPIEPYIVMIADAYDAMTSTRSYRKALPQHVAFQELREKAGIQFHPQCVEVLIATLAKRDEHHGAGFENQPEFADAPDGGLGSAGLGDFAADGEVEAAGAVERAS